MTDNGTPILELRRLMYKLRPPRVAIFIPNDADWDLIDSLIADCSWWWGGHLSLFIPTDGKTLRPVFSRQLETYDPDQISSWLPKASLEELRECLPLKLCSFGRGGRSVSRGGAGTSRTSISLPTLLGDVRAENPLRIVHLESNVPGYLRAIWHETNGYLSSGRIRNLRQSDDPRRVLMEHQERTPVALAEETVPADQFPELAHEPAPEESPAGIIGTGLGFIRRDVAGFPDEDDPDRAPTFVVVGDTPLDFCFYHNLRVLTGRAMWLPALPPCNPGIADEALQNIYWSTVSNLWDIRHLGWAKAIVTSVSISEVDLASARIEIDDSVRSFDCDTPPRAEPGTCTSEDPCSGDWMVLDRGDIDLLQHYREHVEYANTPTRVAQFWDGRAVSRLDSPMPQSLRLSGNPWGYSWVSEVEIESYRLPQRVSLLEGHLSGVLPGRARLTKYGLAWESRQPGGPSDYPLQALLVEPELRLLSIEEVTRRLMSEARLEPGTSDKGRYFRLATEKLGSLPSVQSFLCDPDIQRVLACYLETKTRPPQGCTDQGVLLGGRRYLDAEALAAAIGAPEDTRHTEPTWNRVELLLESWLEHDLLQRGIPLRCSRCSHADWYPVSALSETFACGRCGSVTKWLSANIMRQEGFPPGPRWHYQLDEVFFQFLCHHSYVTAVALATLRKEAKESFMYWAEVGLWPVGSQAGKPGQEIDFIALCDGRVLLGECKVELGSTPKNVEGQIGKYVVLAEQIMADGMVIATKEPVPPKVEVNIRRMFAEGCPRSRCAVRFLVLPGLEQLP